MDWIEGVWKKVRLGLITGGTFAYSKVQGVTLKDDATGIAMQICPSEGMRGWDGQGMLQVYIIHNAGFILKLIGLNGIADATWVLEGRSGLLAQKQISKTSDNLPKGHSGESSRLSDDKYCK